MSGAVEYLFNACGKGGCWTTDEERAASSAGNWNKYYSTACSGGDTYACSALNVASDNGLLSHVTNLRLEAYLVAGGMTSPMAVGYAMENIRVDLAKAYVGYLDSLGATAQNPQFPTRAGITDFHEQVFSKYGASGAFGGTLSDKIIPHSWFDYCSLCSR
jgi:hypothetical protein